METRNVRKTLVSILVLLATAGMAPGGQAADYVIGAVGTPGPITYQENLDVREAVALAGGPSDAADLRRTQLVLKDGNYAQTVNLDLEEYTRTGRPARYIMKKEDLVIVPARRPGFLESRLGQVVALLTAVSTTYLIIDRIQSD